MYRISLVFFFNDTATTEIYTLSLHDALPICSGTEAHKVSIRIILLQPELIGTKLIRRYAVMEYQAKQKGRKKQHGQHQDRKSTRLNSSHANISYAVFCLKKKKHERTREVLNI